MASRTQSRPERVPGTVGLAELASTDPSATRGFLEKVFDWKFDSVPMPQGEYHIHSSHQGMGVGVVSTRPKQLPSSTNYILVKDLKETEARVRKMGGEVVLPRTEIPGMGSFFWFKAPGGPVLACWQDAQTSGR